MLDRYKKCPFQIVYFYYKTLKPKLLDVRTNLFKTKSNFIILKKAPFDLNFHNIVYVSTYFFTQFYFSELQYYIGMFQLNLTLASSSTQIDKTSLQTKKVSNKITQTVEESLDSEPGWKLNQIWVSKVKFVFKNSR